MQGVTRRFLIPLLAACLAACGGGDARQKGDARQPPLVKAEAVAPMEFADRIEAVGTAHANEQVTLSAPVTERIVRLNFDDGAFVQRGQVVAVLRQAEQNAQLSEANARMREAQQQLGRVSELKNRGFATRSSYDAQVAAAAAARAQAQQVQAQIGDRVVRAPFSGWVSPAQHLGRRDREPGHGDRHGQRSLARSSSISRCPRRCSRRSGRGCRSRRARPPMPNQPFGGTIRTIDPVIDPNTRAVTVRAHLPNPDRMLRPGMMMSVAIQSSSRMALSVPELAVLGEGENQLCVRDR